MFIGIKNINALDTSLKVYDYAQILTANEEMKLRSKINSYINKYNMDMVLVTVKKHNNIDTMHYADEFYTRNKFGIGQTYDGVIMVIDFTAGYTDVLMTKKGKAINYYTDDRIDRILDEVIKKNDKDYYGIFDAFIEKADYYAGLGISTNYDNYEKDDTINWIISLIVSIIVPTIIIIIVVAKNKKEKLNITESNYLVDGSVVVNKRLDKFITTHTTSTRINNSGNEKSCSK